LGGYLRGHTKAQVALRDGLTGSLRPGLAEFAAADWPHGMAEILPSIADLARLQSAEVTDSRWGFDVGMLIQAGDYLTASD
jgi:hypothetical protein